MKSWNPSQYIFIYWAGYSHITRLLQIWNVILGNPFALLVFFFFKIKLHSVSNQEGGGGKFEFVWPWLVKALRTYLQLHTPEYTSLLRAIVCDVSQERSYPYSLRLHKSERWDHWLKCHHLLARDLPALLIPFPCSIKVQRLPWGLWNPS